MRVIEKSAWDSPAPTDFGATKARVRWSDGSCSLVSIPQTVTSGIDEWIESHCGQGRSVVTWTNVSA
jgi:hypothetical protein